MNILLLLFWKLVCKFRMQKKVCVKGALAFLQTYPSLVPDSRPAVWYSSYLVKNRHKLGRKHTLLMPLSYQILPFLIWSQCVSILTGPLGAKCRTQILCGFVIPFLGLTNLQICKLHVTNIQVFLRIWTINQMGVLCMHDPTTALLTFTSIGICQGRITRVCTTRMC